MHKKNYKKVFFYIIIFISIIKLVSFIVINRQFFLQRFSPEYISRLYSESQYVLGEKSKGGIGDDGLYAYAGYYYLFQGGDVSNVNFEHPPLGKYLIGFSILLFGNENVINIIYVTFLLILVYKLGLRLLRDRLLSALSVAVLSFDPIFLDHLIRSMLDLPFTLFFTGGIYFFLKGLEKDKFLFHSFVLWGMAFSTKFFPAYFLIYVYSLGIVLIYQRNLIKPFLLGSITVPVIYIALHISFFFYHPSLIEFLRHKKWMLAWFTGSPIIIGNIWRFIFTGNYLDSTRKMASDKHWNTVIPLIVILAVASFKKIFILNKKYQDIFVSLRRDWQFSSCIHMCSHHRPIALIIDLNRYSRHQVIILA